MRTDPQIPARTLATALLLTSTIGLFAQDATVQGEPVVNASRTLNYALVAAAVLQTVLIVALSSILRTFVSSGDWAKKVARHKAAPLLLPALFLLSSDAQAQAYVPEETAWRPDQVFWVLLAANIVLFIILLVQINLLRGSVRFAMAAETRVEPAVVKAPSWTDRVMSRLTRQVTIEQEKDILMHHEYDGIRELDNVLPPWWLWLFYGTIVWSVVYLVNVHVIDIWPDQKQEYTNEMMQAQADIAAYNATLTNTVDETNVEASMDASVLANGKDIFTQFCTPCHGPDAAGNETSVGPNLTDAYWIHGGGAKNIFKTIKYGVAEKGMISWKAQLKPAEISAVTSYIMSLAGTGSATQKAPQGDLWSEAPVVADSTAAPADTLGLVAN